MNKVKVSLEHCYGIKKLNHTFDFDNCSAIAVYAANGAMKSSFAQTFDDLQRGENPKDRIFPDRVTQWRITDETNTPLPPGAVFVVRPYDDADADEKHISTLLVNKELRKKHVQLNKEIDATKKVFIKALKELSKSKKDLEAEISTTFMPVDNAFHKALRRVKADVLDDTDTPYKDIEYDVIFNDQVGKVLQDPQTKQAIAEYVEKYNLLLEASTYFKRGVFNYYNASTIAEQLAKHGFFDAKHSVNLNAAVSKVIRTQKELEAVITEEKQHILEDDGLKTRFNKIDKLLNGNESLRQFAKLLMNKPDFVAQLENIENFKQEIWKSYFRVHIESFKQLLIQYEDSLQQLKVIEDEARAEQTQWETTIDIFNNRFHVPFKLNVKNRIDAMLGREEPTVEFVYKDGDDVATVDKTKLLTALSMGEKKALYVLNIIFEVEVRRQANTETLFIVDDIADSFDYKNKYAIIEYLQELVDDGFFKQIILTHNFDFYRTILRRFVGYGNCLMAARTSDDKEIVLEDARHVADVFGGHLKKDFSTNHNKKIACIPFMRNLIEYSKGRLSQNYVRLTSLLHWKDDTAAFTLGDLDGIYGDVFQEQVNSPDPHRKVMDILDAALEDCFRAAEKLDFEHKVVLSIGIRLKAEKYMIARINDDTFVKAIPGNQTSALYKKFKSIFAGNIDELPMIKLMHRVVLMTPETIHLNSFMYEPIIDMSSDHLKKLFEEIKNLRTV